MSRDEILAEIKRLSTECGTPEGIADRMRHVVELSGQYDEAAYDQQYLIEAVVSALGRFADMLP